MNPSEIDLARRLVAAMPTTGDCTAKSYQLMHDLRRHGVRAGLICQIGANGVPCHTAVEIADGPRRWIVDVNKGAVLARPSGWAGINLPGLRHVLRTPQLDTALTTMRRVLANWSSEGWR